MKGSVVRNGIHILVEADRAFSFPFIPQYKARLRAIEYKTDSQLQVVGLTVAKRAVFQATASMLL